VGTLLGAAGILWYLGRRSEKEGGGRDSKAKGGKKVSGKSPFAFPEAKKKEGGNKAQSTATSALPRNKVSNNKKNKSKRRKEKAEKKAKKEQLANEAYVCCCCSISPSVYTCMHRVNKGWLDCRAKSVKKNGTASQEEQGQAATSVMNYTYFDTARRDTILPSHKKPSLSAADVMKMDQSGAKK